MGEYSIGVDIGGTNLRAAAVAADGVMLDKLSGTTDLHEGREAVIQDIIDSIHRLKEKRGADTLAGVGIGVPGFILMEEGKIIGSNNLPEFENFPMRDDIERKLGNADFSRERCECGRSGREMDGRRAGRAGSRAARRSGPASAEASFPPARCFMDSSGMAAELGHMTVVPAGNPCGCGNYGCLEKHASATAIVAMASMLQLGDEYHCGRCIPACEGWQREGQDGVPHDGLHARNCACEPDQYLQLSALSFEWRSVGGMG